MGQGADRLGQETPGDEFSRGRGWNAGYEEDPEMREEPGLAGLENDIGVADRAHDGGLTDTDINASRVDAEEDATGETAAIRQDIEGTRANMSSTIDEIQDRLTPQRIAEQAKGAVRDATVGRVQDMASNFGDTARDTGSTLMDTIRQNPLPAALIGIGAGWLFMSARRKAADRNNWRTRYQPDYSQNYGQRGYNGYGSYGASGTERSANGYPYDRYGQYGGGQYGGSQYGGQYGSQYSGQQQGSYQSSQQDDGKSGQVTDKVKDVASSVGDRTQDMTDTAKQRASDMAEQAQWQAQRARGWFERTWDENPLVVAGAALAAGALLGLSVPATQAEQRMMGEASGNVLQKAADTAQDVTQNVTEKAQQTMRQAEQSASSQSSSSQQSGAGASSGGTSGVSQSARDSLQAAQENIDTARSNMESSTGSQGSGGSTR
jgi:ElaB/YqjD/DUF883 family membrane-anchored ribosome-binding protein